MAQEIIQCLTGVAVNRSEPEDQVRFVAAQFPTDTVGEPITIVTFNYRGQWMAVPQTDFMKKFNMDYGDPEPPEEEPEEPFTRP